MKAKLLRRIRKKHHIGITNIGSYIWVDKYGYAAYEWGLNFRTDFYEEILGRCGFHPLSIGNMLVKNRKLKDKRRKIRLQPTYRQNLLNQIIR